MEKYKEFQAINDNTKRNTPSKLVGHLENLDFEKDTCDLVVNNSVKNIKIKDVVKAICNSAGCVSNPSALENWKGFNVVEKEKRALTVVVKPDDSFIDFLSDKYHICYNLGDLVRKTPVWRESRVYLSTFVKTEIEACDNLLKEYKIELLRDNEKDFIYRVLMQLESKDVKDSEFRFNVTKKAE